MALSIKLAIRLNKLVSLKTPRIVFYTFVFTWANDRKNGGGRRPTIYNDEQKWLHPSVDQHLPSSDS